MAVCLSQHEAKARCLPRARYANHCCALPVVPRSHDSLAPGIALSAGEHQGHSPRYPHQRFYIDISEPGTTDAQINTLSSSDAFFLTPDYLAVVSGILH